MPQVRKRPRAKDPRRQRPKLRDDLRRRVLNMYDHCAICGRPVDVTLPPNLPLSPEIDEIIPVSRGGSPYDFDNLQLTHRKCNRLKSNKMAGDDLPKDVNPIPQSRNW